MGVVHLTIKVKQKVQCLLLENHPFLVVTHCLKLSRASYLCLTAIKTSFTFLFQYSVLCLTSCLCSVLILVFIPEPV